MSNTAVACPEDEGPKKPVRETKVLGSLTQIHRTLEEQSEMLNEILGYLEERN